MHNLFYNSESRSPLQGKATNSAQSKKDTELGAINLEPVTNLRVAKGSAAEQLQTGTGSAEGDVTTRRECKNGACEPGGPRQTAQQNLGDMGTKACIGSHACTFPDKEKPKGIQSAISARGYTTRGRVRQKSHKSAKLVNVGKLRQGCARLAAQLLYARFSTCISIDFLAKSCLVHSTLDLA